MKYAYLFTYLVVFSLGQWYILPGSDTYAADSGYCQIREISSKKSEQLFIQIAISLLNGESRFVSLDDMVRILKNYEIVEFESKEAAAAREIILREVAFRMLKQHYLPRVGDKIRVYKSQRDFLKDAGIQAPETEGLETTISLPLEIATVRDKDELATIQWADLVMQISTVIEKMRLKRIGYLRQEWGNVADEKTLLEAVILLRRKFIQGATPGSRSEELYCANRIVKVAEEKIGSWFKEGLVRREDLPALTEMLIQYVIHSRSRKVSYITEELRALRDIQALKEALRERIINTTENIKSLNPTDYGAFAMLQSLLNELSSSFSLFPSPDTSPATSLEVKESRHSA